MNRSVEQEKLLIIEPGMTEKNYWSDIWNYRELFFILAWRDISVRYKQTIIGVSWALIRPFLTMVVFTFVFGKLAKMPTEGNAPYPILVFAGMLPWTLFSSALGEASNSLIGNSNLISKVYFPRLIIPSASIITSFIDFLLSFTMMILIMAYYNYSPTWRVLLLPFFTIWALLTSFGPGLFVTSLNVKYRDFRYVIPFIVQFGLYISPVGFSSQVIPEKWKLLYSFNPMVSVIDGFRWCLIGGQTKIYPPAIIAGILSCCFFLWLGISQFRKMEKSFADLI